MATAILIGLTFLATALDRNGVMLESERYGAVMGIFFLIAFCVAVWTDLARASK